LNTTYENQLRIIDSFVLAWKETREKTHSILSFSSFFNDELYKETYNHANHFIHSTIDSIFDKILIDTQEISQEVITQYFNHLKNGLIFIKQHLIQNFIEEPWIDVPISTLNNCQSYLFDIFNQRFNHNSKLTQTFLKFNAIKDSMYSFITNSDSISKETYSELTQFHCQKIIKEFGLSSIHFMDSHISKNNFSNIQKIYSIIKDSQQRNGLPTENLGANSKLNIVISDTFLNEQKWTGIQSKTKSSFSIFINPKLNNLKQVWTHEYTHFLDRLAAHVFYQENNIKEELSSFSHIALNSVVNNKPIKNKVLKIMAETMSATIGGVSSEDFYNKINDTLINVKKDIGLKFILEGLPDYDKTWESFEDSKKRRLLMNPKVQELTNFIILQVSNNPQSTFNLSSDDTFISIDNEKIIDSKIFVPDISHRLFQDIRLDPFEIHSKLLEYIECHLANDVKKIMKEHNLVIYKDHSIYYDRFFLSPGNEAAKTAHNFQYSDSDINFSYYDKPLELLARMSENLQTPLMNNFEYKQWVELAKPNDLVNPILGKDERMMLCATLHSLARYVGIDVPHHDLAYLPCVTPNIDETFNITSLDDSDFNYATPNQIVPDKNNRKFILRNIESLVNIILETKIIN